MLAVSSLRDENQGEVEGCIPIGGEDNFPEFGDGNLLDSIDFDDLFTSINDGDVFPDLDIDSDILADFSAGGSEESEFNTSVSNIEKSSGDQNNAKKDEESDDDKVSISGSSTTTSQETLNNKRDETATTINPTPKHGGANKCKKSSSTTAQSKNFQGKRKVKVDWTPELHRRFVQAVEQLGVDKAVPSRILDLMGIDCLTRHNIASHLQKYRSHRKHLLAREVGAASWSQRRQMYGSEAGVMKKRDVNPWMAPTIGFPPPVNHMHHHFRPLHVWGHPTHVDQSLMHLRPNNLPYSLSPPPPPNTWPLNLPPRSDPNYGNPNHQRVPNEINSVSPYFPRPLATTRYARPPGPGLPPLGFYKVDPASIDVPAASGPHPLHDFHPSKESIDAAIGDVISKPWLPLPLGLKPPSMDSVMGELHLQGVPKVPHNF